LETTEHRPQSHSRPQSNGRPQSHSRPQSNSSIISREIVRLHARLYGRGPTKAKTYVQAEYVLCVLEDIFTPSELTLLEAGKEDLVRETRVAFQEATRDEFVGIVERTTGRRVRGFHSQIDPQSNTAAETFVLAVEAKEEPKEEARG
jgi:uncharacterized protein YbcI